MKIKTTSGGTRGQAGTGMNFAYEIEKETFLSIIGEVFKREAEDYKPENVKAGGMISQFLHAYGVSAEKLEKSGIAAFPLPWPLDEEGKPESWESVYSVPEISAEDYEKLTDEQKEALESEAERLIGLRDERLAMTFGKWHAGEWFKAIDFETPRAAKVKVPLEERQAKWDGLSNKMSQFMSTAEIEEAIGKRPAK